MTEAPREDLTLGRFVANALGSIGLAMRGERLPGQLDSGLRQSQPLLQQTYEKLTSVLASVDSREYLPGDIHFLHQDPARDGRRRMVAERVDQNSGQMSQVQRTDVHALAAQAYIAAGVPVPSLSPSQVTPDTSSAALAQPSRLDLRLPQRPFSPVQPRRG